MRYMLEPFKQLVFNYPSTMSKKKEALITRGEEEALSVELNKLINPVTLSSSALNLDNFTITTLLSHGTESTQT